MFAEGIHYVVLRLNILFRSKDVFDTAYQDFMNFFLHYSYIRETRH